MGVCETDATFQETRLEAVATAPYRVTCSGPRRGVLGRDAAK
jgi:hypothetical protein